jgi:Flp pilus assembly pilin Flp
MEAMAGIIRFFRCETGATATEYGLLVACISLVIVGAVTSFGMSVRDNLYQKVVNVISN